ncbi:hypothetical protein HOI83_01615 [Candidatus Uhrbacteria bacterium]|jgi:hypothetical protein|nr:hypothetical protein [Candidatus Uhrbacteria bacterium]
MNYSIHLTPREANKYIVKYTAFIIFLIAMSIGSVAALYFRYKYDLQNFKDIILVAMPFVTIYASYGFMQMAKKMKEVSKSDQPVLVLTEDFIEIEGQRMQISSLRKVMTQAKVTFIYPDESKQFVRIVPYMRGDEGMKIDLELMRLWNESKTK